MAIHNLNLSKTFISLLLLILAGDAVFIALHILQKLHFLNHPAFLLTTDGGYAEVYQYLKEGLIAALFLWAATQTRSLIFFAWSALFCFLLLDDSLQFHENAGEQLAHLFSFTASFNMQPRDLAQPFAIALFVAPLLLFLTFSYAKANAEQRMMSNWMLLLLAGIGFFGVAVDMMHAATTWGFGLFALIEESGEMAVMSGTLVFVVHYILISSEQTFTSRQLG
ncbi:hypothetical protein [Alteromonas ponticola]|uniref:DUF998 domain-containing protein n=1 Tax=Alteromonas ponticola TaxID=2720613 RepID=A0ABX1R1P4_9ALTE|nr:hypothetical protein [Alteromonas ponticola]NMH59110.1 hypothetical protein [Alteromonas ponticola]